MRNFGRMIRANSSSGMNVLTPNTIDHVQRDGSIRITRNGRRSSDEPGYTAGPKAVNEEIFCPKPLYLFSARNMLPVPCE